VEGWHWGRGETVRFGSLATPEFLSAYKAATSEDVTVNVLMRSEKKDVDVITYAAAYR
jgi:hypothetical protein